jgi:protein ImuB
VVLVEEIKNVQRVRFVSKAASALGVYIGQAVTAVSALAPNIEKRRFVAQDERKALCMVGESLLMMAPHFEVDSPDGLWLDGSAAHLWESEDAWGESIIRHCSTLGFRANVVVGSERFSTQAVARLGNARFGSRLVGNRLGLIEQGGASALAETGLDALSRAGIGLEVIRALKTLGLSTLGEVAGLPIGSLTARFGVQGHLVAQLACGRDTTGLSPEPLSDVVDETVQLDWPAEQLEPVMFAFKMAVDRVCARLLGRQQAAIRLQVGLVLEGVDAPSLLPIVLARPTAGSKLLLELIRHRLLDLTVNYPITAVRIRVEEACPDPGRQMMLGDSPVHEEQLEVVLSKLQSVLGAASLFSAQPVAQHLPEKAFDVVPFRPPDAGRLSEWWGALDAEWTLGEQTASFKKDGLEEDVLPARAERKQLNAQLALLEVADASLEMKRLEAKHLEEIGLEEMEWAGPRGKAAAGPNEAQVMDVIDGLAKGASWKRPKTKGVSVPLVLEATWQARPSRVFQKPALLHTSQNADGLLSLVTLQGRHRRVEAIEGPERIVGQWWTTESTARDYYRVRLEGVGVLWVFKNAADGRFYAHGIFD